MQFSFRSFLGACIAAGVIFASYQFVDPTAYDLLAFAMFIAFYVAKLWIALRFHKRWAVASVLYFVLLLPMTALGTPKLGFEFDDPIWFSFGMLLRFLQWYIVPSATFAYDLFKHGRFRFQLILWRTTFEIVVICPIVFYVVSVILVELLVPMKY